MFWGIFSKGRSCACLFPFVPESMKEGELQPGDGVGVDCISMASVRIQDNFQFLKDKNLLSEGTKSATDEGQFIHFAIYFISYHVQKWDLGEKAQMWLTEDHPPTHPSILKHL